MVCVNINIYISKYIYIYINICITVYLGIRMCGDSIGVSVSIIRDVCTCVFEYVYTNIYVYRNIVGMLTIGLSGGEGIIADGYY